MQELIRIETTPAHIAGNFDEVEQQLREYLQRYDVVVTTDTVGDAKKLRTELRKQIADLDSCIKEALKDASEPIREADERRKLLVRLGRDVENKIKEQVGRFENEMRAKVHGLLGEYRNTLWADHGVTEEFCSAEYDDLIKLTAVTKTGNLSAAAKKELESRVRNDKALQDQTERRLTELAGASYEAGLAAPLTRDHVEHFLLKDDEKYAAELRRILDAEVERQKKAEQRMRDQAEREAQQKALAEAQEQERKDRMRLTGGQPDKPDVQPRPSQPAQPPSEAPRPHPEPPHPPAAPPTPPKSLASAPEGKETWAVTLTFRIHVPAGTASEAIKAEARNIVQPAALKTLHNVLAHKANLDARSSDAVVNHSLALGVRDL